jgi:hypothetical protein
MAAVALAGGYVAALAATGVSRAVLSTTTTCVADPTVAPSLPNPFTAEPAANCFAGAPATVAAAWLATAAVYFAATAGALAAGSAFAGVARAHVAARWPWLAVFAAVFATGRVAADTIDAQVAGTDYGAAWAMALAVTPVIAAFTLVPATLAVWTLRAVPALAPIPAPGSPGPTQATGGRPANVGQAGYRPKAPAAPSLAVRAGAGFLVAACLGATLGFVARVPVGPGPVDEVTFTWGVYVCGIQLPGLSGEETLRRPGAGAPPTMLDAVGSREVTRGAVAGATLAELIGEPTGWTCPVLGGDDQPANVYVVRWPKVRETVNTGWGYRQGPQKKAGPLLPPAVYNLATADPATLAEALSPPPDTGSWALVVDVAGAPIPASRPAGF